MTLALPDEEHTRHPHSITRLSIPFAHFGGVLLQCTFFFFGQVFVPREVFLVRFDLRRMLSRDDERKPNLSAAFAPPRVRPPGYHRVDRF